MKKSIQISEEQIEQIQHFAKLFTVASQNIEYAIKKKQKQVINVFRNWQNMSSYE